MNVKYAYLDKQFENVDEYFEDLRELVKSGEFTLGPYVEIFEKKFANYIGIKHCISVNTGTDALILCLKSLGIGAGDEVITVANTFYATVGAIVAAGAKPVFVDADERLSIDVSKIEAAITPKTRAIIPVHWAGVPCDINEVCELAKKHNLKVVEDACPSVGANVNGKSCGTFGDINAFSMHPLKPLNVWGDGGMIVTDNDELAEWLRKYRNHGMTDRNHIEFWGVNARLQPVQAVVATRLLDEIESDIQAKIENAKMLDEGLKKLSEFVICQERPENMREVYQIYIQRFKDRDNLVKFLIKNGIEAKVHYPVPLHLQPAAKDLGYKLGDFPNAERQANEVVTLPMHRFVSEEQIQYMLDKITEFYEG
jgi:aminotransferase EvaB